MVVSLNGIYNKQWDKCFGGSGIDVFSSLDLTCDGGFILGGNSRSGIDGDKSQNNWDTTLNSFDYWIVKVSSNGIKQWDKRYGGKFAEKLTSLQTTSDGGFILGGTSNSGIEGDKTQQSKGSSDFWIVKTDSLGNIEWDKDFGGNLSEDDFGNITQTCDRGYLCPGTSYSDSSGDKSQNNIGREQTWVIKLDSLGNKQWDKTLLTDIMNDDESGYAIQNKSGEYLLANSTYGGIGGDKSQPSWGGSTDFWISKYHDPDLNSCISLASCYHSRNSDENNFIPEILIYPNPTISNLSISIKKQNLYQVSIYMYDVLGQEVLRMAEYNLNNNFTKTLNLSSLSNGVYFLEIIVDEERFVRKVLKD